MRLVRQVWNDILWLNSTVEPAMKVVGVLGTLALFIGGLYIGKAWWLKPFVSTRIIALLIFLSLIFFCYLVSAAIRSRRPMLRVGHLRPTGDASRDDCLFQTRVIKRSYKLKPDQSESLKYKAKRVRLRSIFWR